MMNCYIIRCNYDNEIDFVIITEHSQEDVEKYIKKANYIIDNNEYDLPFIETVRMVLPYDMKLITDVKTLYH